jgi:hypothetical protein
LNSIQFIDETGSVSQKSQITVTDKELLKEPAACQVAFAVSDADVEVQLASGEVLLAGAPGSKAPGQVRVKWSMLGPEREFVLRASDTETGQKAIAVEALKNHWDTARYGAFGDYSPIEVSFHIASAHTIFTRKYKY